MYFKSFAFNVLCLTMVQFTMSPPSQAEEAPSQNTITFHGSIVNGTADTAPSQAFTTFVSDSNYKILKEVQKNYLSKHQSWNKDNIYPSSDFNNSSQGVIVTRIYN